MAELFTKDHFYLVVFTLVSILFLWSGSFMFMRSRTSTYLRMTGLAMVIVWFYVSGSMLVESSESVEQANFWVRWSFVIPWSIAFWFHGAASLVGLRTARPTFYRGSLFVSYGISTFLVFAGTSTGLLIDYALTSQNPAGPPTYFFSLGVLYPVFSGYCLIFLSLATGLITIHAIRAYPHASSLQRAQDIALSLAAWALWLSASIMLMIAVYVESWKVTEIYAQPVLLLAYIAITFGTIGYRGVMDSVGAFRSYLDASTAAALIFFALSLVLLQTDANMLTYISVAFLALFAYGYHDARLDRSALDVPSSWFTRLKADLRSRSLFYESREDPVKGVRIASDSTGKGQNLSHRSASPDRRQSLFLSDYLQIEQNEQIEFAIKNFFDHNKLERSPLLQLDLIVRSIAVGKGLPDHDLGSSSLERMNTLRFFLREAVYQLKPTNNMSETDNTGSTWPTSATFGEEWGPFAAALYYVEGGRNAEKKWESIRESGGEVPLELRVLIWRRLESQGHFRKWRDKYLLDAVQRVTEYVLDVETQLRSR